MFGYGYVYSPYTKNYTADFEIVHDPHDLYWTLFGGESKYDMSWLAGNARIVGSTSRNAVWHGPPDPEPDPEHGDPRAISAKLNQLRNPDEWEALKKLAKKSLSSQHYSNLAEVFMQLTASQKYTQYLRLENLH